MPNSTLLRKDETVDAIAVAALTFLSALPYLPHLGFYSDDWALLANFSTPQGESLLAWDRTIFPGRPVQGLYLTALYRAFGFHPLAYHLVNTAVLAISGALLCTLLVRLGSGRALSLAAALLFVMLPQLSTVRVWYAAFQVQLSLALALASIHCLLCFFQSRRARWLGAALIAAALSFAAYEIFAPLIAGFAAGLMFVHWRRSDVSARRKAALQASVVVAVIGVALLAKLLFSGGRLAQLPDASIYERGLKQLFRLDYDWRVDSGMNVIAAPQVNFWAPIEGWWAGARALLTGGVSFEVGAIAVITATVVAWRLASAEVTPAKAFRLLVLGIAAFALGNMIFAVIPAVFTPTGITNRLHVAAAVGVALIFVALIALATRLLSPRWQRITFCAVVASVIAAAFVRLSAIERYWAETPALQLAVLDAARADLRDLPSGSTVILDGVCPYHGPAVVFETSWDVAGALTLALGRPVTADTVSQRMKVTAKGLKTSFYGDVSFYPYGDDLYIYSPSRHLVVPITDRGAAVRFFASRPSAECPGKVGRGAEV